MTYYLGTEFIAKFRWLNSVSGEKGLMPVWCFSNMQEAKVRKSSENELEQMSGV